MSGPFDAKYTDEQREAVALARVDGGRTAKRVQEMAAAGELKLRGEPLAPFDIALASVYDAAKKLKRQRMGKDVSQLAELPHRDAIETLRRRLVNVGDSILKDLERKAEKEPAKLDVERLRQVGRVVVELARIPAATEPQPATQSRTADGRRMAPTVGGVAGALVKDHRRSTAQDVPHNSTHGEKSDTHHEAHRSNGTEAMAPGALTAKQDSGLAPLRGGG